VRIAATVSSMQRALIAVAVAMGAAVVGRHADAQSDTTARHSGARTSTLSGIYTTEQASRGQDVYSGSCRGCHTPASHTGATFATYWLHKSVADLFVYVGTNMPKNDPGSLDPHDVADVVAYLLKMNQMPAGSTELIPDTTALRQIRIDAKSSPATSTSRGQSP
jgi:S-disulfanyl-L-cysteine oxidoreductase SoxD